MYTELRQREEDRVRAEEGKPRTPPRIVTPDAGTVREWIASYVWYDLEPFLVVAMRQLPVADQQRVLTRLPRQRPPTLRIHDLPGASGSVNHESHELALDPSTLRDGYGSVRQVLSHEFTHLLVEGVKELVPSGARDLVREGLTEVLTVAAGERLGWGLQPMGGYRTEVVGACLFWAVQGSSLWSWYTRDALAEPSDDAFYEALAERLARLRVKDSRRLVADWQIRAMDMTVSDVEVTTLQFRITAELLQGIAYRFQMDDARETVELLLEARAHLRQYERVVGDEKTPIPVEGETREYLEENWGAVKQLGGLLYPAWYVREVLPLVHGVVLGDPLPETLTDRQQALLKGEPMDDARKQAAARIAAAVRLLEAEEKTARAEAKKLGVEVAKWKKALDAMLAEAEKQAEAGVKRAEGFARMHVVLLERLTDAGVAVGRSVRRAGVPRAIRDIIDEELRRLPAAGAP
jgi:hypothetical protein